MMQVTVQISLNLVCCGHKCVSLLSDSCLRQVDAIVVDDQLVHRSGMQSYLNSLLLLFTQRDSMHSNATFICWSLDALVLYAFKATIFVASQMMFCILSHPPARCR